MPACVNPNPVTYPLSTAQMEIWLAQQINPRSPVYNICQFTEIHGAVDSALFEVALRQVITEAESFCLQFIESSAGIQQFVSLPDWSLPLIDLSAEVDPQAAAEAWMKADYEQPTDLLNDLPFGFALLKVASDRFFWYQRCHHIAMDGAGGRLIAQRMAQVYSALVNGVTAQERPFGPVSLLLENDLRYRASARFTKDREYWLAHCADWPSAVTLADKQAPALHHRLRQTAYLSSQTMRTYASDASGLAQFITAAVAAYLHRLTGTQDVVLGFPVPARFGEGRGIPSMTSNVMPIRLTVQPDTHFTSLIEQAAQEINRGFRHQRYRGEELRRELRLAQSWQLFGPTINLMPFDNDLRFGKHASTTHNLVNGPVEDLMIAVYVLSEDSPLRIDFDANPDLYTANELMAHQRRFLQFLDALVTEPTQPIDGIDLLSAAERQQLLVEWNMIETPYPAHQCLHQLFEEQVERTPDAIALVYEDQALGYAELNARANRLAHQLIELGVQPDTLVAICVERSLALVVGLLAILKAGGAYVPLDPAYTGERLASILTDAAPRILLADAVGRATLGETALASLTVLDPAVQPEQAATNPHVLGLTARHLAYVIYTSGSTGAPKGVMVEHAQIVRLFDATEPWYHFNQHDTWCLFHSFAFDFSVWELWGALRYGGKLILVPHQIARSPQEFHRLVCEQGVTVLNQTPSAFKTFIASQAQSQLRDQLRYVIFGGEAFEPAILQAWYAMRSEHAPQLVNMYGITETTVHVTYRRLRQQDCHEVGSPIGVRIPDLKVYLLDTSGQPVPLGMVGELYIGGAGVARGYLNRPELTAERFLCDSFSNHAEARMYKTGDLARYLPDGNLEFLGRNDHQVKIRGFRIEPGEIETRLNEHPQVRDAVVLALDEDGDKRLVAYVVAEVDEQLASTLRTYLVAGLPEYMVPAAFVRLDALPLTPNGKLDRQALPAPDGEAFARQAYEAPQGKVETTLATIWAELLGVECISRHDSFFALGGHSMLAVRMIERLRSVGLTVSVRALFDTPMLSELAQSLGQHREVAVPPNLIPSDTAKLTPAMLPLIDLSQAEIDQIAAQVPGGVANIQDIYALSPLQDGFLFHHLLATEGDPYLLIAQMAFTDREQLDRYLDAIQQVVKRHDTLRTAFVWAHLSKPAQVVWRQAPLSITELTLDPADGPITEQLTQRFRQHRLDLTQAPLLRFVIAQNSDGRWLLVQLLHHLIEDHSTLEIMQAEVQAFLEGRGEMLPAPQPFRNLVAQTRLGMSQAAHERFFTDMLAKVKEPTLPFGLTDTYRDGTEVTESRRLLPQELNDRLRVQAKRLGVSLASLCHLAWAQVLARSSGLQRAVFGTVLFGRMQAGDGADRALGLFINTLPLCVELKRSVEHSVRDTHALLAGLLDHEHASLALAQRCSGVPAGTSLFSALLNYRHHIVVPSEGQMAPGIEVLSVDERTNYPLALFVEDFGKTLGLIAQVVSPLDPNRICGYMQQALQSLAEALEQRLDKPAWQLEVLPSEERELLHMYKTDDIARYLPDGKLNRQALPTPDNEAFAQQAHEAPQGKIEIAFATIWTELLGLERISRYDSFFALGGHSLLAVRMINRIRTTLGVEMALHMLFETPTIAGLAQRLRKLDSAQDDSFNVLLSIKPEGTRPPLFCVHPVAGLSWSYIGLSQHLEADQPVYGLQAHGLSGVSQLAETIDTMASDYIKHIRRIQPNGPYYLLGWSFGGNVVHSIATQFEQQGERVSLLALLDSHPGPFQRDNKLELDQETTYIKLLDRYSDENISDAGEYLWEKTQNIIKNNLCLLNNFSPLIYSGDMLFFRATIAEDGSTQSSFSHLWKPYVLGNIETYDIHCKHNDMDRPVPTAKIGRILARKLDELQKKRHPPQSEEV